MQLIGNQIVKENACAGAMLIALVPRRFHERPSAMIARRRELHRRAATPCRSSSGRTRRSAYSACPRPSRQNRRPAAGYPPTSAGGMTWSCAPWAGGLLLTRDFPHPAHYAYARRGGNYRVSPTLLTVASVGRPRRLGAQAGIRYRSRPASRRATCSVAGGGPRRRGKRPAAPSRCRLAAHTRRAGGLSSASRVRR